MIADGDRSSRHHRPRGVPNAVDSRSVRDQPDIWRYRTLHGGDIGRWYRTVPSGSRESEEDDDGDDEERKLT